MAMSSAGDCPLPVLGFGVGPGSWTSSAALYRFVWAVKRQCLTETALHVVLGRATLALWISGLELSEFGESGSCDSAPGDEGMLEWMVMSVRGGWTPREALTWIFPQFGGLLFDLALDATYSF